VTVCSAAGIQFGYSLIWAIVLSTIATIILQEMAARIGIMSGKGLAAVVRQEIKQSYIRTFVIVLICAAIIVGNAAYEAGNISGSVLGIQNIVNNKDWQIGIFQFQPLALIIGILAFVVLYIGKYKLLASTMMILVGLMSIAYISTALLSQPDWSAFFTGLVPQFPDDSIWTIMALLGTTVVPYNLFLHSSLSKEKWGGPKDIPQMRTDTITAISLGGIISLAILMTAANTVSNQDISVENMVQGLEPLFGSAAGIFLGIGLFAAGISSAITAPLAAAYVACDCFGWSQERNSIKFRAIWMLVLGSGVLISSMGLKPIEIITFAQFANGLLLPLIAGFLLWVINRKILMGNYRNSFLQNVVGVLIWLIAFALGFRSLWKIFETWNTQN
jgi:manganese transport protein